MGTDPRAAIAAADIALGIEFDSTCIKAVLIGPDHEVLATGGHGWESHLGGGLWPYTLDEVVVDLRAAYASLVADMRERYGVVPASYDSIGISTMVHGYLAFDAEDNLLTPFHTWHNTSTERATDELTRLFGSNIPLRWLIAHLRQAVLDSEEHALRVACLTALTGWVHHQLAGRHAPGAGGALDMFPIDSEAGIYVESYLNQYEALVEARVPWRLRDVLPTVLGVGGDTGTLTPEDAALIDPAGTLQAETALCPPEGGTGTSMIATNTIAQRTGNTSCGASVFLVTVLEHFFVELHTEIDMMTMPDGSPVAMVHSNNGASELDVWVGWFADFARPVGANVSVPVVYDAFYNHALTGEADAGGVMTYNTLPAEPLIGQEVAQPVFTHTVDMCVGLANAVHAQLMSIFAAVRIGVDILRGEGAHLNSFFVHGGLLKTPDVAQQILADSLNIPISMGDTAGEGGTWGIAALARYRAVLMGDEAAPALSDYLSEWVFAGASVSALEPTHKGMAGYERFLGAYRAALSGVKAITRGSAR